VIGVRRKNMGRDLYNHLVKAWHVAAPSRSQITEASFAVSLGSAAECIDNHASESCSGLLGQNLIGAVKHPETFNAARTPFLQPHYVGACRGRTLMQRITDLPQWMQRDLLKSLRDALNCSSRLEHVELCTMAKSCHIRTSEKELTICIFEQCLTI
jgi:hypothetical protein